MSSAISTDSTKKGARLKGEPVKAAAMRADGTVPGPDAAGPERDDAGFQAWHFFVLASLVAATIAVVMSRQATPEHLILISLMIGAAGAAAAAFYRTLAPLAAQDVALFAQRQSERARTALEREKALVLRSIKELEFDRAMGKVSSRDFDEMSARLRARAMMLIKQADEGGAGYRELIERELSARLVSRARTGASQPTAADDRPSAHQTSDLDSPAGADDTFVFNHPGGGRSCAECGTANDVDASFCKRCGSRLETVSA
jgi:hypothetical protein